MDIKQLARSLGITQKSAVDKAAELLRLLKLKVSGSLGQGEICRPAVCLELACQITPGSKLPVRDEFIRYSCSKAKVYNEMFTRIQRLLDVRPALDLRELVTLFGCSQLHDGTQQLLRVYKSRFLQSLSEAERARADLSRPALLAAAFLLTAKKQRARVDRAALIEKMGLTRAELATAMDDFSARCEDQLAPAAPRKRGRDDGGTAPEGETADPAELGLKNTDDGQKDGPRGVAKRRRRGITQNEEAEGDQQGPGNSAAAVAVDDFKLVLIGLGPSGIPPAGDGPGADGAATGLDKRSGRLRKKTRTRAVKDQEAGEDPGVPAAPPARVADVKGDE